MSYMERIDQMVDALLSNRAELTNFVNDYLLQEEHARELEQENERLRKALEFYADENIYDGIEVEIDTIDSLGTPIFDLTGVLIDDNGETARKALEGEE